MKQIDNLTKKATDIFINNTKYKLGDIVSIRNLHLGYTNISFLVKTKDGDKYHLRLGQNNQVINRKVEKYVLSVVPDNDYIYCDISTGNAIKKWINGHNPNKYLLKSNNFLRILAHKINQIQDCKIDQKILHELDYQSFINKSIGKIPQFYLDEYLKIIKKYSSLPLVLTHTDITKSNIIVNHKKISVIDWEWACLNNIYWDYANFIREHDLSCNKIKTIVKFNPNLDINILKQYIFVCSCYAWQWSNKVDQTPKVQAYTKLCAKKTKRFWKQINNEKNCN